MTLTISSVLSRSWKAFSQNVGVWLLFDLVLILFQIPNLISSSSDFDFTKLGDVNYLSDPNNFQSSQSSPISLIVQFIGWICGLFLTIAATRYANAHLKGKKLSFSEAVSFKNFWSFLGNYFLIALINIPIILLVFVGLFGFAFSLVANGTFTEGTLNFGVFSIIMLAIFLASLVLVIWVNLRLTLAQTFAVLTDKGAIDSIGASWKVLKGKVWFLIGFSLVFGCIFLISIIPFGLGLLITVPIGYIAVVDIFQQLADKNVEEDQADIVV
jgi:uncharacterized membrane protein